VTNFTSVMILTCMIKCELKVTVHGPTTYVFVIMTIDLIGYFSKDTSPLQDQAHLFF